MTGDYMLGINHFVRIDQVWSYNMIGSLKGVIDLNMHVVDDLFKSTAAYLLAKHNFHLTKDNLQYNGFLHKMREHLDGYEVGFDHFQYYFDNLFRIISPALAQIPARIIGSTTITNNTGEIEGFVFQT